MSKKVEVYSTPTCVYCTAAKEYFSEHGIAYSDYNVATDLEKRQEMVEKSGQMGVPVITIGDEVVIGFDEARLAQILGIK